MRNIKPHEVDRLQTLTRIYNDLDVNYWYLKLVYMKILCHDGIHIPTDHTHRLTLTYAAYAQVLARSTILIFTTKLFPN